MANVFIHYNTTSEKDAVFFTQIETRLKALLNNHSIAGYWHTGMIDAGDNIGEVIDRQLAVAQIVLLLISSDYFADDQCKSLQEHILLRKEQAAFSVIPILLRPVDTTEKVIQKFTPLPKPGEGEAFLSRWADLDEAYLYIELELKRLATEWLSSKNNKQREVLLQNSLMRFNFSKEIPPYITYSSEERKVYAVLVQGEQRCSQSLLLKRLMSVSKSANPKVIPIKLDSAGQDFSIDALWRQVAENFSLPVANAALICSQLAIAMAQDTEIIIKLDPVERYHVKEIQAFWTELVRQLNPYRDAMKKPLHFYIVDRTPAKEWNATQLCCDNLLGIQEVLHLQIAKITKDEFINWLVSEKVTWGDDPQLVKLWQNRDQIMPDQEAFVGEVVDKICEICEVAPAIVY